MSKVKPAARRATRAIEILPQCVKQITVGADFAVVERKAKKELVF
jgi:hypothetical protein